MKSITINLIDLLKIEWKKDIRILLNKSKKNNKLMINKIYNNLFSIEISSIVCLFLFNSLWEKAIIKIK
jgi:hypothetical protein